MPERTFKRRFAAATGETPQPLPVRIYSAIRFGVTPTINAIGTLMLTISLALVALALVLQVAVANRLPLPGSVTPDLVLLTVTFDPKHDTPATDPPPAGDPTGF